MLLDVLTRISADTGLNLTQQRSLLSSLANRAASEMYKELECNKIFRECTLLVPRDSVVSLPAYIGELRGMRMHTNDLPFDLHSMAAPRYVSTTWAHKFKNWRDLGESALHTSITATGPLKFKTNVIEATPVSVCVTGQTNLADRIEEKVLINSLNPMFTAKLFGPRIDTISCFTKRTADITIYDSAGVEIAVLYNHQNKTRYKRVDVSKLFWSVDTVNDESLIDVLYKVPYTPLLNDSDSFPAGDDFDDAWYYYSMAVYFTPMQGREAEAQAMRATALASMMSAKDSGEGDIVKKISFGRNKYFSLFNGYQHSPGSCTNVDKP